MRPPSTTEKLGCNSAPQQCLSPFHHQKHLPKRMGYPNGSRGIHYPLLLPPSSFLHNTCVRPQQTWPPGSTDIHIKGRNVSKLSPTPSLPYFFRTDSDNLEGRSQFSQPTSEASMCEGYLLLLGFLLMFHIAFHLIHHVQKLRKAVGRARLMDFITKKPRKFHSSLDDGGGDQRLRKTQQRSYTINTTYGRFPTGKLVRLKNPPEAKLRFSFSSIKIRSDL